MQIMMLCHCLERFTYETFCVPFGANNKKHFQLPFLCSFPFHRSGDER